MMLKTNMIRGNWSKRWPSIGKPENMVCISGWTKFSFFLFFLASLFSYFFLHFTFLTKPHQKDVPNHETHAFIPLISHPCYYHNLESGIHDKNLDVKEGEGKVKRCRGGKRRKESRKRMEREGKFWESWRHGLCNRLQRSEREMRWGWELHSRPKILTLPYLLPFTFFLSSSLSFFFFPFFLSLSVFFLFLVDGRLLSLESITVRTNVSFLSLSLPFLSFPSLTRFYTS